MTDLKNTYRTGDENGNEFIADVVSSIFRPKDGKQLLTFLKERKKCEVVDWMAIEAGKALEDNNCGFSFSFKKSKWNFGWAGFERI